MKALMRKFSSISFIIILIVITSKSGNTTKLAESKEDILIGFSSVSYFIEIKSDEDFNQYDFKGDGSLAKPFLIEYLVVSDSDRGGVLISNITKYVEIRSCTFDNLEFGIYLDDVEAVKIINNTFSNADSYSVLLAKAQSNILRNNSFKNSNDYAVEITSESSRNLIYWNDFVGNAKEKVEAKSQVRDDGRLNFWYNEELSVGNYWDDKGDNETYHIDGTALSIDLYPREGPIVRNIEYYGGGVPFSFFPFLISLITLVLIRWIWKQTK